MHLNKKTKRTKEVKSEEESISNKEETNLKMKFTIKLYLYVSIINSNNLIEDEEDEYPNENKRETVVDGSIFHLSHDKCICTTSNRLTDQVFEETEIVPEVLLNVYSDNKVQLKELINILFKFGYPLEGSLIYYFQNEDNSFIFCGSDPIALNTYLIVDINIKTISLKCHCFIDNDLHNQINLHENFKSKPVEDMSKRKKERKISNVIEKVNAWRKLYNGFYDENNNFIKYTLDDAARYLDVSKKSLDDYLLQLRMGRKYGFDFNSNRNAKVGILRSFVKEKRLQYDEVKSNDYI